MGEILNKSTVTGLHRHTHTHSCTHKKKHICHNHFISEWTTFAPHSSILSQHTCCQGRRSQQPCGHLEPLWMEEWAKPCPWQTADWAEPLCRGGCMWHHVTPAAMWDLGQAEVYCVARAGAPLCTRPDYPAMSRPLFRGPGRSSPHSRTVRSCGRNILPLIQEKTTVEQIKQRCYWVSYCYVMWD